MKNTSLIDANIKVKINPNIKAHPNPAPRKMAMATAFFEKYHLAKMKKHSKELNQPPLSVLQTELLTVYSIDPTEQQMLQLKDFLAQLFGDKLNESKEKKEKMVV
jgi:hypothetical protein